MPFLLGIDVGTTAVKSAMFSDEGLLIDQASVVIGAPFGDIVLAGRGIGLFPDLAQTIKQLVTIRQVYEPRPQHVQGYQEMFALYKNL